MPPSEAYPTPFWLVWSPTGPSNPRYEHASASSAEAEAERLALRYPGQEFYVVEPTYRCVHNAVDRTRYHRDGVPF